MPKLEDLLEKGKILESLDELEENEREVAKLVLEGGYKGPMLCTRTAVIGHTGSDEKFAKYYREVLGAGEEVVG